LRIFQLMKRVSIPGPAMIVLALILVASCGGQDEDYNIGAREVADQVIHHFTTVESDSGVVKWRIEAPVARVYSGRDLLVTDNPVIYFFAEDGEVSSVVNADKGEINQKTRDLTAIGNVVVTSTEGYTLETESLVWLNSEGMIHTEDYVKFTKENDVVEGYGFRGYPELKEFDIIRDINGNLYDEEGRMDQEMERETGDNQRG